MILPYANHLRRVTAEKGDSPMTNLIRRTGIVVFWIMLLGSGARGQQSVTAPAELAAYPDLILYNGKIITVDDDSFSSQLGTIAQAMHVRNGKVLHLGDNARIRAMAGSDTQMVDLKGRTVLPGMVVVHDHPFDWAHGNPYSLKKVLTDDIVVNRYVRGTPEEQAKAFPGILQEALSKAKPGQFIHIVFHMGDKYEYMRGSEFGDVLDGKMIPKEMLNRMVPNNPVVLENPFVGILVNDLALAEAKKVFPWVTDNVSMRWMFHDVMMKNHYPELREIHRLELSWWSGYGVTTFGSGIYSPANIKIYHDLSTSGQMSMRNMWVWYYRENALFSNDYVRNASNFMEGLGNDFFWYGGSRGAQSTGGGCSSLPARPEQGYGLLRGGTAPRCSYEPGSENYNMLYQYIKNGGRYVGVHTVGDGDIDYLLEIIERASEEAGFTLDQIRAKRHTFDHLVMAPRPDQLPRIKRLGMVLGGAIWYYIEEASNRVETYGERAAQWMIPKKSLVDAGIPSAFEIDRPLATTSLTVFWTLARVMDRKRPQDGKVYAPNQRIGRELALKMATNWGAFYLKKEDQLGTLEPGKWADFIVLDRDYLTIPEDDIENIRVLMTMVGGRTVHLVPSLAGEIGMPSAGAQVTLGSAAAQW